MNVRDESAVAPAREATDVAAGKRSVKRIAVVDVADTYDRYARFYDRLFGAVLEPGRRAMGRAVRELNPDSILEVGVGTGLTLAKYPQRSRVVGIDLSAHMLEHARQRAGRLSGRDISLQVMDAEAMDFDDDSFDCVAIPYVLSVTPRPARLVAEARRVCRPGGSIVLVNHFSGNRTWWLLEAAARPLAARIGFRPDFDYEQHVLAHDWTVTSEMSVNLLGLSKLVVIRND